MTAVFLKNEENKNIIDLFVDYLVKTAIEL